MTRIKTPPVSSIPCPIQQGAGDGSMEATILHHQDPDVAVPVLNLGNDLWTSALLAVGVVAVFFVLRRLHRGTPVIAADADLSDVFAVSDRCSNSGEVFNDIACDNDGDDEEEEEKTDIGNAAGGFGYKWQGGAGLELTWDPPVVRTWEGLRLGFCADEYDGSELEQCCPLPVEAGGEVASVVRLWDRQGGGCLGGGVKGQAMQRRRRPTVKMVRFTTGIGRRGAYAGDGDDE